MAGPLAALDDIKRKRSAIRRRAEGLIIAINLGGDGAMRKDFEDMVKAKAMDRAAESEADEAVEGAAEEIEGGATETELLNKAFMENTLPALERAKELYPESAEETQKVADALKSLVERWMEMDRKKSDEMQKTEKTE